MKGERENVDPNLESLSHALMSGKGKSWAAHGYPQILAASVCFEDLPHDVKSTFAL